MTDQSHLNAALHAKSVAEGQLRLFRKIIFAVERTPVDSQISLLKRIEAVL